jgi:L-fuculose-phosphate aldolase
MIDSIDRVQELRAAIVEASQALDARGLMPNKSGNVSCRSADGFLITPSGVPYGKLTPGQMIALPLPATDEPAGPRPSSEWRMHAAIYSARPDVLAIVHTHSPRATALACAGRGIPAFHYMIALAGGDIRCMPYATFGSDELANHAVRGLEGRRATLLSNHGVVAVGTSLQRAQAVAIEVENLAGQYLDLLSAGLEPVLLSDSEMQVVNEKFAEYGRISGSDLRISGSDLNK